MIRNYQDLIVWQKAMELAAGTYNLTKRLPREELYALSDQMRRAAVSIPSNIAEGHAREYRKEFARFLSIAKGSTAELETQLLLCVRLEFLTTSDISELQTQLTEVSKMLHALSVKVAEPTSQ
jgi:four helix bundle protein